MHSVNYRSIVFLFFSLTLRAQTSDSLSQGSPLSVQELGSITRVEYDLPVFDSPYNRIDGFAFPSMAQSLAMTKDITQGIHWSLAKYGSVSADRSTARLAQSVGFALSEIALISFPGGYSWLHEEWHRAVLKNRGIDSYDGVYDFRILS
ncbi:MAG: hypothetical protein ABSF80_09830, partial [Chitinispirillaceae bacterium]